jgi:PadR family transcriptional regulator PadR
MDRELLKGHLPVLVLGMLSERPRHGYALCREIQARKPAGLKLGEGTLYPLLHRLEEEGCIRARWETSPAGKARKVYRVTPKGRRRIAAHARDMQQLLGVFSDLLGKDWAPQS